MTGVPLVKYIMLGRAAERYRAAEQALSAATEELENAQIALTREIIFWEKQEKMATEVIETYKINVDGAGEVGRERQ